MYRLVVGGMLAACLGLVWAGCSGDKSSSPADLTAPAVPTGLSVGRPGDGEVPLSWTPNKESDLAGYRVYRSEDDEATYVAIKDISTSAYMDAGLSYETTYYYSVSAYDHDGNESARCAPVSARPRNTSPPLPPKDLKAFAHNLHTRSVLHVMLTWAPNRESDLAGYRMYRSLTEEFQPGPSTLLADTTQTTYTDEAVEVGKFYHYVVTAYDREDWESPASNIASDIPLETPVLLSPADGATTHTAPTFQWDPVYGAASYKVILTTSPEAGEIWIGSTAQTHLAHSGGPALVSGTTYYWKVGTITNLPDDLNSISAVWSFTAR